MPDYSIIAPNGNSLSRGYNKAYNVLSAEMAAYHYDVCERYIHDHSRLQPFGLIDHMKYKWLPSLEKDTLVYMALTRHSPLFIHLIREELQKRE